MENAYLALRWNNHNTIFTKILNLLREQETYTDVSLSCGGRFYAAHKFVLSTCSDYFKAMFSNTPCKHPVIFLNDVAEKDIESLLDFMYKGEIHVPQNDLGSLLRTAEALQVKGLAVPDDSAQSTKSFSTSSNSTPAVPSSNAALSNASDVLLNLTYPVKRKRTSDGNNKKEELPKLTPSQDLSVSLKNKSKARKNRVISMPELKRFKMSLDEKENLNGVISGNHNSDSTNDANYNHNICSQSNEEPTSEMRDNISSITTSQERNGLIPTCDIKLEVEDVKAETVELNFAEDQHHPEEGEEEEEEEEEGNGSLDNEIETEEHSCVGEEEDDEGADENSSPVNPSDLEENSSLPSSEISHSNVMSSHFLQNELLQVDISEDGTQFIIGSVLGGEASRASSAAEEEVGDGPKKPFVCVLCGHTFTRRDNLANHLKTHTGDRPFMCQYCRKCFSRKDYLKQHERIHTGEKPYSCTICGRAFTRKEGLTDHMRCHSDFKAFSCETCGKSFKQKCGLRFHKRNYRH